MNKIGNSFYQKEAKAYYANMRKIHSMIFTSAARKTAEKTEERYTHANAQGIANLYSLISILIDLLKGRENITGIDYGCGSHYFVDDMATRQKWDVTGYDPDKHAIREARQKYPGNRKRYRVRNLLKKPIPVTDNTQDFVFCNAVIQHFDYDEVDYMFDDISRVLRPGGIFLLIFKNKPQSWQDFRDSTGLKVNIIDEAAGRIEIEDTTMKKALAELDKAAERRLNKKWLTGMRLFHFFSVEEITRAAAAKHLQICQPLNTQGGELCNGIITYRSGKGIPAAALFFIKK